MESSFFRSFRFWISVLVGGAKCLTWTARLSLNMAIVCMVNSSCTIDAEKNCTDKGDTIDAPTYNWTSTTQGLLLSAAFAGFCIALIPSGLINEKFGTKRPLAISLAVNGILTALIPLAADYIYLLAVLRLGNGAVTG